MKKIYKSFLMFLATALTFSACTDSYMEETNTDKTKTSTIDPNAQLTTALLQTYGDFALMDTYRSYITGFTQYYAGGWNVSNYAGAVYAKSTEMGHLWQRYYTFALKNIQDAIDNSADKPNTNAALRIHKAYLLSILTDTYGDIPCSQAALGYSQGITKPVYDKQEDIYSWLFEELEACANQLGTGIDIISGDVTSMNGDTKAWKRYANSLRMRYAMRISDVNPSKAKAEFEKAMNAEGGYINDDSNDAYVIHMNSPFTLYDGATDYDFRANALGEILYGQDPTSPTFVSATLYNYLKDSTDPRFSRICRNYLHTSRSQTNTEGNYDLTDEVNAWKAKGGTGTVPCIVGDAWWHEWINGPANSDIPTLARLVEEYPSVGYNGNNFPARLLRPTLCTIFENADCPGILFTSAEAELLLAEAALNGWSVNGSAQSHYEEGVRKSMQMMNKYYITPNLGKTDDMLAEWFVKPEIPVITSQEIEDFIQANPVDFSNAEKADSAINTQAWILHLTNPSEGWANARRSDYPVLMDRRTWEVRGDFPHEDANIMTPTRLKYPDLEQEYNRANYDEAVARQNSDTKSDDWHKRVWWDTADQHFYNQKTGVRTQ